MNSNFFDYEINLSLAQKKPDKGENKAVIAAGATAFALAVIKLIAGVLSGSIAVMSSAIDSMLDFIISLLNFFALKKSRAKANANFNFGFSKLEALCALFEGIFIIGVAVFIFYQSVLRFRGDSDEINLNLSICVMILSLVITGALILFLNSVAKRTDNLIIRADALHYKSDFYTNLGVIIALFIIKFTAFVIIDAIFGIVISGYIAHSALNLIKDSASVLLDKALDNKIIDQIKNIIKEKNEILSFHYLTTRCSGDTCFMSVHLVFSGEISLLNAHKISDEIETQVKAKFSELNWEITTHLDPFDDRVI